MLGFSAIGMRPIGMLIDYPLPAIVIAASGGVRVYTLEVFSPVTGERVISAATREFITRPSDTLSNHPFFGYLNKAISYTRSVADGNAFSGIASGLGEIELENWSGEYDDLEDLAGARMLVKVGPLGGSFDTYYTLLDGIVERCIPTKDLVRIESRDNTAQFDVAVQDRLYAGTGAEEGDASLAQKPMPLSVGMPNNITPTFVDPANDVHQYGTGRAYAGPREVRDDGIVITLQAFGPTDFVDHADLVAGTVSPGSYITCIAQSKIRLGAPARKLRCDVYGASDGAGGLVATAAQIVRYFVEARGWAFDSASFTALDALQDAVIDYYIDSNSSPTFAAVFDDVLGGIDAYGGIRRDGVFEVGRIDIPADASISATYTELDIFNIERVPMPGNISPTPWRITCPYSRNWTIDTDLSEATDPSTASFAAIPYKLGTPASDDAILAANKNALDLEPKCFFAIDIAANAEANRRFALLSAGEREMFAVEVSTPAFAHKIGSVVKIFHSRFEFSEGRTCVAVGTRDDVSASDETVEITVLTTGPSLPTADSIQAFTADSLILTADHL